VGGPVGTVAPGVWNLPADSNHLAGPGPDDRIRRLRGGRIGGRDPPPPPPPFPRSLAPAETKITHKSQLEPPGRGDDVAALPLPGRLRVYPAYPGTRSRPGCVTRFKAVPSRGLRHLLRLEPHFPCQRQPRPFTWVARADRARPCCAPGSFGAGTGNCAFAPAGPGPGRDFSMPPGCRTSAARPPRAQGRKRK